MSIAELPVTRTETESEYFVRNWNPLVELQDSSINDSPSVLIYGDSGPAHQVAAELIAKLISQFPNMTLFVVPETPANAEAEIDKTSEVMEWLGNLDNRGNEPAVADFNTPIPLVYLSTVKDLYEETSLVRMVRRARFLGMAVIAIAGDDDRQSSSFEEISGMFTHSIEV
jgi:hypothetical protein